MAYGLWKPETTPRKSKGFVRGDTLEGWNLAFVRGKEAAERGVPRIDNPMADNALRRQWYEGYDSIREQRDV